MAALERGKKQEPEVSISISGIPESLVKRIESLAEKDRRSRSSMIALLLEESVARADQKQLQPA